MSDPFLEAAARVVGEALPSLIRWAADALKGGKDPAAELDAMMTAAEAAAREYERQKFEGK